ncbi:hypothetical protein MTO96_040193, partial [Rhipicephalus appendiculatus]
PSSLPGPDLALLQPPASPIGLDSVLFGGVRASSPLRLDSVLLGGVRVSVLSQ